jgi:hypothetical protein
MVASWPLAAKRAPSKRFSALALVPVGVALALGPLMLPRPVAPTTIPMPSVDLREIERVERSDRDRARRAEAEKLPDDARVLGQAVRDFNVLSTKEEARTADPARVRRALDEAMRTVLALPNGIEVALSLRAVQLEHFLAAVNEYERTGQSTKELDELGGSFVRSMHVAGWEKDHRIAMDEHTRRVAFKLAWNAATQASRPELEPTLDEMRVLYTFYLQHPHAPDPVRAGIDAHRRAAKTRKECEALDAGEMLAAETWRLEKIERLAKLDPSYPAGYARGVVLYRLTRYEDSARELQRWLDAHPEGPYALRARGHLRAALVAKANTP